jgi:hypothetical protein
MRERQIKKNRVALKVRAGSLGMATPKSRTVGQYAMSGRCRWSGIDGELLIFAKRSNRPLEIEPSATPEACRWTAANLGDGAYCREIRNEANNVQAEKLLDEAARVRKQVCGTEQTFESNVTYKGIACCSPSEGPTRSSGHFYFAHLSPSALIRSHDGIPADAALPQARALRSS